MLEVRRVGKSYPAVQALKDVSLGFPPGRVHGVVGENGAGKSTLLKILSGIEQPTTGELVLNGKPVSFRSPAAAIDAGVSMIHQELNLVDELSVADNLFLGRERRKGPWIDRSRSRSEAEALLSQVGARFPADLPVSRLSVAEKQLVEIAKAVRDAAHTILMDEPTAVLTERETAALFELIRRLRQQGTAVVYVSHRLPEVLQICEDVTVFRDGELIESRASASWDPESLAKAMVGRALGDVYPPKVSAPDGGAILRAGRLEVRPGEIVGVGGLVGAGRTELCEGIAGLRPRTEEVVIGGQPVPPRSPAAARAAGIAYLSEDRKAAGLHLALDTVENATLANLRAYARPLLDRRAQTAAAEGWVQKLSVRVGDLRAPAGALSGGNQQKVALAKQLETRPKVLLLDEPTRGVDVGAKQEIYRLIADLAAEGMACVVVSSELPELLGLCHRILVMREGTIVGEVDGEQMSEESVMMLAAGVGER